MDQVDAITKKQRSHSGCARCKRRRQKCDETRPHCGRCSKARVSCEYSVLLRWGGRPFERSRFGECLRLDAKKVGGDTANSNSFVYTSSSSPIHDKSIIPQSIDQSSMLSITEKGLLYHFTNEASRITCCSPHVQKELCELTVPMAYAFPSLMNATLAWAAIHSVAFRGRVDGLTVSDSTQLIASLKAKSIEHLRQELRQPSIRQMGALLATVRTLCQCEIHSGSDEKSAWRVHLKGAKALIDTIDKEQLKRRWTPRLLYRWYASLDALAMIASSRAPVGNFSVEDIAEGIKSLDVCIDEYNGFSIDLSFVLGKIGAAVAAKHRNGSTSHEEQGLDFQTDALETAVQKIMERDNSAPPVFHPGVIDQLSPMTVQEYSLCNESFQHTALIHIRRRLRNLPTSSTGVQESVKRIIECAESIPPTYGLSPSTVLTTPLFTAGCEALGDDRQRIRTILLKSYDLLKIRNIQLALDILESHWEGGAVDGDVDSMLYQKNWDFIPY